jgi:hypothetical protein
MLPLKKFLGTENGKIMKNLISKRKKKKYYTPTTFVI